MLKEHQMELVKGICGIEGPVQSSLTRRGIRIDATVA
jgi:hypothetical protein